MDDSLFSMLPSASSSNTGAAASSSKSKNVSKRPLPDDSDSGSPSTSKTTASKNGENGESKRSKKKKRKSEVVPEVLKEEVKQEEEADPMEALENGNDGTEDQNMDQDVAKDDETTPAVAPVKVTDDFEQQAEREVAATAGFAAVDEKEKMRLVHQVRHQVSDMLSCFRASIPVYL